MKFWTHIVMVAFVMGMLAACTSTHPNLPQQYDIIPGEVISVAGNKNVYAIAQEHNVSMREIIVLNNLQPPFTLRAGQSLTLPAKRGTAGLSGYNASNEKGIAPAPFSAPLPTIESAPLTPIQALPPKAQPQSGQVGVLGAPVTSAPVEDLNKPTQTKPINSTAIAAPKTAVTPEPTPAPTHPPSPPASVSLPPTEMKWPVQGPVLSTFGPKGQGLNNDGVNIGAPKGAPVVAAANGMVVYAGNEMKGFGNLVLIRHPNGWVTAYAHLDRTLVAKDAVVAQGDMIGTVGKTGNVPSPQLHFETRHDGKPVDPAAVVKAQ